ncbi:MAG TPA: TIGR03663 family protein, partial [Roseiflexaceae bacterium]
VIALVFVLPGKPQQSGSGVARANGPYVCPTVDNPRPPANDMLYTPGPILGLAPLATADNDYALCVRNQYDDNLSVYFVKLGQFFGHPAILAALALALAGAAALYALIWRVPDRDGATAWQRARAADDGYVVAFASLGRDWRVWTALLVFLTPYTLLFTSFFRHPSGFISGTTGSLLYWLAQHNVQRGSQPGYYYLLLLTVYEPVALIWGIVGLLMVGVLIGRRLTRRSAPGTPGAAIDWGLAMPVLLAWWAVATLVVYSWAGEKMPWLTSHIALPIVLLGAWALGRTLRWWTAGLGTWDLGLRHNNTQAPSPKSHLQADELANNGTAIDNVNGNGHVLVPAPAQPGYRLWDGGLLLYLGILGALAVLFFLLITIVGNPGAGQQSAAPFLFPLALVLVGLLTVFAGLVRGARWAIGALALGLTLVGMVYGARSAYQLSYRWGDDARELMVFVQTSPDVTRVVRNLERAATRRNGDLKVWYDNETIWQWYMRRFKDAQQQPPALPAPDQDVMAVLLLQENVDSNPQNLQNLQGFRIQRYPLRWWNPEYEIYRLPPDWRTAPVTPESPLLMRLLRTPFDGPTSAQLWQYLIYRKPPAALGSTDFVIAVRPEIADEIGLGTGTEQK